MKWSEVEIIPNSNQVKEIKIRQTEKKKKKIGEEK